MVDLLNLISKFRSLNDRETEVAFYRTHVPWVAPEAYLNIIHKPAKPSILSNVSARMMIPIQYIHFLNRYNGAILLSGTVSLYGVVLEGQLLKRSDPFSLPPFNIETENRSWPPPDRQKFLVIGAYGLDGSLVCMDRGDFSIQVFHREQAQPYHSWSSLDDWLEKEVERLSKYFDSYGRRLVNSSKTLPTGDNLG
jgi:hypothetical protein